MKGPELPWSPEQEHLQEVQRNTFQEGQNELGGFRERKSRAGESGPLRQALQAQNSSEGNTGDCH